MHCLQVGTKGVIAKKHLWKKAMDVHLFWPKFGPFASSKYQKGVSRVCSPKISSLPFVFNFISANSAPWPSKDQRRSSSTNQTSWCAIQEAGVESSEETLQMSSWFAMALARTPWGMTSLVPKIGNFHFWKAKGGTKLAHNTWWKLQEGDSVEHMKIMSSSAWRDITTDVKESVRHPLESCSEVWWPKKKSTNSLESRYCSDYSDVPEYPNTFPLPLLFPLLPPWHRVVLRSIATHRQRHGLG